MSLTFSRCLTNESSVAIVSPFVSEVVLVKSKTKGNTMAFLVCDRGERRGISPYPQIPSKSSKIDTDLDSVLK